MLNAFQNNNQFVMLTVEQVESMINTAVTQAVAASEHKFKEMMARPELAIQSTGAHGEPKTLTVKEVKEMLHVDETTLWRYDKKGILQKHSGGERRVLYYLDEVMAFMNSNLKGKHHNQGVKV